MNKHSIIQVKQFSVKLNNLRYSKGYTTHTHTPFTQNITIK